MQYIATVTQEGRRRLVTFPDCPGCQTFANPGDDIERVANEALEGWLEAHLVAGTAPPARVRVRGDLHVVVSSRLAIKVALRQARLAAGLTQAQLAKRAGIAQPMISQLEHPDYNPTLDTLAKVAKALDADLLVDLRLWPISRRGARTRQAPRQGTKGRPAIATSRL